MPKKSQTVRKITEYNKVIINHIEYHVGDSVIIKESNDDATYGKILKIFRNSDVFDAFLTISWYYKPSEIFEQVPDYISEAELFDSDLQQIFLCSAFMTKQIY